MDVKRDEKPVYSFWNDQARRSSSGDYLKLLMSVFPTDDPLIAAHRHYCEEKFIRSLRIRDTDRVLDLGCGFGRLTFVFAGLASHVEGIDFAEVYIETANRFKNENRVANVRFVCTPVEQFAADPESFDLIFLGGLLPCIQKDEDVLALILTLRGYLKAGGRLVIREPAPSMGVRITRKIHTIRTVEEIGEMFRKAGLRPYGISEVPPVGPVFYKVAAAILATKYSRTNIDLVKAESVFRVQEHFTGIIEPLLRVKEMITGRNSDVRIYFHVYQRPEV